MHRFGFAVLAALVLSTAPALGDPDKGKGPDKKDEKRDDKKDEKRDDKKDEKRDDKKDDARDDKRGGGRTTAAEDDDDEAPAADGGRAAAAGRRTPAQMAHRKTVWERREKDIDERVHKGGKRLTDEEREAIRAHWLQVARLLRIREIAQEDGNDAAVKRVDAALAKEEASIDAKLDKLGAKAHGGGK